MSERRKVWTLIQTRAPGEKGERIGGAVVVGRFAAYAEADAEYWRIRRAGGAAYVTLKEV